MVHWPSWKRLGVGLCFTSAATIAERRAASLALLEGPPCCLQEVPVGGIETKRRATPDGPREAARKGEVGKAAVEGRRKSRGGAGKSPESLALSSLLGERGLVGFTWRRPASECFQKKQRMLEHIRHVKNAQRQADSEAARGGPSSSQTDGAAALTEGEKKKRPISVQRKKTPDPLKGLCDAAPNQEGTLFSTSLLAESAALLHAPAGAKLLQLSESHSHSLPSCVQTQKP